MVDEVGDGRVGEGEEEKERRKLAREKGFEGDSPGRLDFSVRTEYSIFTLLGLPSVHHSPICLLLLQLLSPAKKPPKISAFRF